MVEVTAPDELRRVTARLRGFGDALHGATPTAPRASWDAVTKAGGAVVLFVRRPGWRLCREEALALRAKAGARLAALGVPLVAVAKERLGAEEFARDYWPPPLPLHFDLEEGHPFFTSVNGGTANPAAGLCSYLCGGRVKQNWERATAAAADPRPNARRGSIAHNWNGEGVLLGGLAVVAPGGAIAALWRERVWGDKAPVGDVVKAAELVAAPTAPARVASFARGEGEVGDGWLLSSRPPEEGLPVRPQGGGGGGGGGGAKVHPAGDAPPDADAWVF